jgi:hypothetical protein
MTLSEQELEQILAKTISLYNRLRSPEVTVKLVSASPANVTVSFSGGFCYDCSVFDYVESCFLISNQNAHRQNPTLDWCVGKIVLCQI